MTKVGKIKSFTAFGYEFREVSELTIEEKHQVIGMLLDGLARVSPEIRCGGNPLEDIEAPTQRNRKTELTFEECKGDINPINFGAFDRDGIIGAFHLYGITIVSDSRTELVVNARPMPAFNQFDGQEYASFALDMMEFFIRNDFTLDDGRTLKFESIEFSTFFKEEGDRDRNETDIRVELVEQELVRRTTRGTEPLRLTNDIDGEGRHRSRIRKPSGT